DKTRRVKAAFDAFDADGSGELEVDELREVMAHLGLELTKGEFDHYVAALMQDYDVDNSGSLDFWEFEKFYEQCLASDDLRAAVHAAFKKFDTDKSGSLEIPELYNVLKEIGVDLDRDTFDEYADALMEDYDEDDSGTLDFREFHKF
ncbi:predicted protein, partial [Micromonas commoda]